MPEDTKNQAETEQSHTAEPSTSNRIVIKPSNSFQNELTENQMLVSADFSTNQSAQEEKSKGWKRYFIFLGLVNVAYLPLLVITTLFGSYSYALFLIFTPFFLPAFALDDAYPFVACVILAINIISVALFLYIRKTRVRVAGIAIIISSALLIILQLIFSFQKVEGGLPGLLGFDPANISEQAAKKRDSQYARDNAKPEITREAAVQLLKGCELETINYTNQTEPEVIGNFKFPAAETSSTGIVLIKSGGKPVRINIADRLLPALMPIAREAQKTCGKPQFLHDGGAEQYKDGKWYFNGQVVNDTRAGKTKEEAITFMQSCKADYFVGYTDINLVKDSNTKSWLNKAEESSSGIEISEDATKSYVFTSKAMTTSLQDAARQFRQSCYSKKKLYITIDNWVETEYPAGKWTRVSR